MKLKIGKKAPDFTLPSHLDKDISLSQLGGKNVVIAFFPLAWTPIWSEQIPSYEAQKAEFAGLNTQVLGISVDHVPCLKAWAESLGGIAYPLLSDFWPHGKVAERYGVLRSDGRSERAIFIIDREGIIRYIDIHDIDDQPDNRILFEELRKIDPEAASKEPPKPEPVALPKGGIVMYCTKWCQDCRKARVWLKEQNLDYIEVDIYGVPGALEQARKWGNGKIVTPVFDIDGTIILDFDEPRLRDVLKR
jgi:peroxiredoxin/glutaredoxin